MISKRLLQDFFEEFDLFFKNFKVIETKSEHVLSNRPTHDISVYTIVELRQHGYTYSNTVDIKRHPNYPFSFPVESLCAVDFEGDGDDGDISFYVTIEKQFWRNPNSVQMKEFNDTLVAFYKELESYPMFINIREEFENSFRTHTEGETFSLILKDRLNKNESIVRSDLKKSIKTSILHGISLEEVVRIAREEALNEMISS